MNTLLFILAIFVMIGAGLKVILGPFIVGTPKKGTYDASWYIGAMFSAATGVLLAGRIFHWW